MRINFKPPARTELAFREQAVLLAFRVYRLFWLDGDQLAMTFRFGSGFGMPFSVWIYPQRVPATLFSALRVVAFAPACCKHLLRQSRNEFPEAVLPAFVGPASFRMCGLCCSWLLTSDIENTRMMDPSFGCAVGFLPVSLHNLRVDPGYASRKRGNTPVPLYILSEEPGSFLSAIIKIYAVSIAAAFCRPSFSIAASRIWYFGIFPAAFIGNSLIKST